MFDTLLQQVACHEWEATYFPPTGELGGMPNMEKNQTVISQF